MNVSGEIGNGTVNSTYAPVDVVGLTSGVACVAAGETHTCAVTTGGAVKCWGEAVSNGSAAGSTSPTDVPGLGSGVTGLASGESDTCAMVGSSVVKCWGPGGEYEKDPTTNYGPNPVTITGVPSDVVAVAASDGFNCLLRAGGAEECWGANSTGQLGNGSNVPSATPVPVMGLGSDVKWLSGNGGPAGCAVLPGGHLKCWGNIPGQAASNIPVDVPGLTSNVVQVSVGGERTACVIMADTSVQCWTGNNATPAPVGVSSAVYVAANEICSCALLANGKISCWGAVVPFTGSCLGDGKMSGTGPVEVLGF